MNILETGEYLDIKWQIRGDEEPDIQEINYYGHILIDDIEDDVLKSIEYAGDKVNINGEKSYRVAYYSKFECKTIMFKIIEEIERLSFSGEYMKIKWKIRKMWCQQRIADDAIEKYHGSLSLDKISERITIKYNKKASTSGSLFYILKNTKKECKQTLQKIIRDIISEYEPGGEVFKESQNFFENPSNFYQMPKNVSNDDDETF